MAAAGRNCCSCCCCCCCCGLPFAPCCGRRPEIQSGCLRVVGVVVAAAGVVVVAAAAAWRHRDPTCLPGRVRGIPFRRVVHRIRRAVGDCIGFGIGCCRGRFGRGIHRRHRSCFGSRRIPSGASCPGGLGRRSASLRSPGFGSCPVGRRIRPGRTRIVGALRTRSCIRCPVAGGRPGHRIDAGRRRAGTCSGAGRREWHSACREEHRRSVSVPRHCRSCWSLPGSS
mmetsp:Transcript_4053/g.9115  ORF Transcript_4053/g.9115 Transcript_4053/m.9115 type:complete len:226 (-) Transcript_4053:1141-1818(-)